MSSQSWTDVALLALLAAGSLAGWRQGGFGLAGTVVGLGAGALLGWAVSGWAVAPAVAGSHPLWTGLAVLLLALLGAALGRWLGGLPATLLARLHLGVLDRGAGAAAGLALALLAVGVTLLVIPDLTAHPAHQWLAAARRSTVGTTAIHVTGWALQAIPHPLPSAINP